MSGQATAQVQTSLFGWVAALAAALAFSPLFEQKGFLLAAAVMSTLPLFVGVGLRWLRAPWFAVLPAQLLVLPSWLTILWVPETARYAILPSGESVTTLVGLGVQGIESSRLLPPPVAGEPGIIFLTALGITACFLLVDLLGAGLGRVPLVGLPLLALYTVPAAIAPGGVPTLSFVLGALVYVAFLAAEGRERLAHWGRQLSLASGSASEAERRRLNTSAVNASAQRIGLAAIATAAVIPLLLPAFSHNLLFAGGNGAGGDGVRVDNPIVDLQRDLVERSTEQAMLVRTPGPAPEYFRLAALDQFDGERWTISDRDLSSSVPLDRVLAVPPGLTSEVTRQRQRFVVDVASDFASDWLPAPYAPRRVIGLDGEWRFDAAMLDIVTGSSDQTAAGTQYALEVTVPRPTAEQLADPLISVPASVATRYGELPDDLPDEVGAIADEVTGSASDDFAKAIALQEYFTGGQFEYSLTRAESGHDGEALVDFLEQKVGYCEQFAATMAVMARLEGIPSRVSVGFLRARSVDPESSLYQFTYADMHAWPELYFGGVGWVRFEPTPADRVGARPPGYTTGALEPEPTADPTANQSLQPSATATPSLPDRQLDPGAIAPAGQDGTGGGETWSLLVAAVLLVLLLGPAVARLLVRRLRWAGADGDAARAEAAWAELRDCVLDVHREWPALQTPRRTVTSVGRLVAHDAAATVALQRIALAVERARFSRRPLDGIGLRHDVADVRGALQSRQSRWDRVRGVLLPVSLRVAWRERTTRRSAELRSRTRGDDASALPSVP